jgi:hypothetical protein
MDEYTPCIVTDLLTVSHARIQRDVAASMNGSINHEAVLKKRRASAPAAGAGGAARHPAAGISTAFLPDANHLTVVKCTSSGSDHHAASGLTVDILQRAADERATMIRDGTANEVLSPSLMELGARRGSDYKCCSHSSELSSVNE